MNVVFNLKDAKRIASVVRRNQFEDPNRTDGIQKNMKDLGNIFPAQITGIGTAFSDHLLMRYAWKEIIPAFNSTTDAITSEVTLRAGTITDNWAMGIGWQLGNGPVLNLNSLVYLQQKWMKEYHVVGGNTEFKGYIPYCSIVSGFNCTFPVKVRKVGGSAGDCTHTCSFTYDVYNDNGTLMGTGMTPHKGRLPNVEYYTPADDTYGLATYSGITVELLEVYAEYPKTKSVTIVTAVTCNGDGTITVTTDTGTLLKC